MAMQPKLVVLDTDSLDGIALWRALER
jgi:hypothetical protein